MLDRFIPKIKNFFKKKPPSIQPQGIVKAPELFEETKTPKPSLQTLHYKNIVATLSSMDQNPDAILKKKGLGIYDDMEDTDAHLYAVYSTRKLAVSRIPWEIIPSDSSKRAEELAEFSFTNIDDCKGLFSENLKQLLDAIGKGLSMLEIVWSLKDQGKWKDKYMWKELIFHKQKYWFFKSKRWNDIDTDLALFGDPIRGEGNSVPWSKLIHYAYDAHGSLYGRAAFKPIYWYTWFKKEGWKSWIIFLNKFGTPTALGEYPPGASTREQDSLLDVINSIQEETGVIIPDNMKIKFLEATRSGAVSYRELSDACNAEISKAILGATQTVEEGRRGSYALSRAHSGVRMERVDADGIEIADVIQQQGIKPLIDFNFITVAYPQFVMRSPGAKDVDNNKGLKIFSEKNKAIHRLAFISSLKIAFGECQSSTERQREKFSEGLHRIEGPHRINVGPIKNALADRVGNDDAFRLAGNVSSFILHRGGTPDAFREAFEQLCVVV